MIVERSILNQIDNAYFSIKPDTIKPLMPRKPFTYYEKTTSYNLDDFTRFSTMKDVFTELIKHVWTGTDRHGKTVLKVRNYEYNEETDFLPLVFIDGVFVQDHEQLLTYNARKVEKIIVLRDRYEFGTQNYQGVILVETIQGDYQNILSGDYLVSSALFKPQQRKSYYQQKYDNSNSILTNRIPDFRSQLLWVPLIKLIAREMNFQFFTSDTPGDYEISLEGITVEGKLVSLRQLILVE
jgi:hypothetical protein